MALLYANSFATDFTGVTNMQSQGTVISGNSSPAGIGTGISIVSKDSQNVYRARLVDSDATTASGLRSELVFAANALGNNECIDFEMRIDDAEWAETGTPSDRMIVFQVHNEDSISAAVNFLLLVEDRNLVCWHPATEPPSTGATYIVDNLRAFPFDVWNRITLCARWVNASTGYFDLYLNGAPINRILSRGTAYNADAPYPKLGIYATGNTGFGTRTAYYRNFAHYRGAVDSFSTVMGTVPQRAAPVLV